MKHLFKQTVLLLLPSVLFTGCATSSFDSAGRGGADLPMIQPGATKAQVLQGYGPPTRRTMTSRGEIWTYWLNEPGLFGVSLGAEPQTAGFVFDANGTVIDYHVTQ